jgi:hypothetical protein
MSVSCDIDTPCPNLQGSDHVRIHILLMYESQASTEEPTQNGRRGW